MEYLASGKVIVATYTDEYKDKRHLLEMTDHISDFLSTLDRVLANLSHYNSPARMAARKAFGIENTYSKKIDKIFTILQECGLAWHARESARKQA